MTSLVGFMVNPKLISFLMPHLCFSNIIFMKHRDLIVKDTSLSALFRPSFHQELRQVINSWRPFLIGCPPDVDALDLSWFAFDFSRIQVMNVLIDLGRHLCHHPLVDDNMRTLAIYLVDHTNLSCSMPTLYAQLRKSKTVNVLPLMCLFLYTIV